MSLDYWWIDRKNEINQADPNSIIGTLPSQGVPNSKIPGAIPNSFIYYDVDGNIGTVTGFYRNASSSKTDGFDFSALSRVSMAEAGNLSGQIYWTHVNKFTKTNDLGEEFNYAGTHGPLVQSAGGGGPKDRVAITLTWDYGPVKTTLGVNYYGPIEMVDHQNETTTSNGDGTMTNANTSVSYPDNGQYNCGVFTTNGDVYNGCKLPSFTTVDLFAKWQASKAWELTGSIQNLFNTEPPFDPYLAVPYGINYNQTWHQAGAVGRFFTIGVRYTFF